MGCGPSIARAPRTHDLPQKPVSRLAAAPSSSRARVHAATEELKPLWPQEAVWDELDTERVKTLRLSWLLGQGGTPKLARCHELPHEAFVGAKELRELFARAPDKEVLPLIAVVTHSMAESPSAHAIEQLVNALAANQQRYARFGFSEMGIIVPWCSFKDGSDGSFSLLRSSHEDLSFTRAKGSTLELWYAHPMISAILLDASPRGLLLGYAAQLPASRLASPSPTSELYTSKPSSTGASGDSAGGTDAWPLADGSSAAPAGDHSGWAAFARLLAEQQQKWQRHIGVPWDVVLDLATPAPVVSASVQNEQPPEGVLRTPLPPPPRHWPVSPDDFETLAQFLAFASQRERDLACKLFRQASVNSLGAVHDMHSFDGLSPPSVLESVRVGSCCNYMDACKYMDFTVSHGRTHRSLACVPCCELSRRHRRSHEQRRSAC
jgi:hypothetical protein